jgi:hypothetical protein
MPPPPVPTYQVRGSATGVQGLPGAQLVGINGAWCEPGDEVLPGTVLDVSLLFPGNTLPKVSIYSEDLIRDSGETPPRQGVALTLLVDGEHAANVVPVITCRDMTP